MCLSWKFTSVVSRLLPTKWSLLQCFNGGWPSFGACWGLWEVVLKSVLRHLTAGCYWWNRSCSSADFFCQERSDELHKQETKTRHELEDTGVALQAAGTPSFFVQLHIVSRSYIYILWCLICCELLVLELRYAIICVSPQLLCGLLLHGYCLLYMFALLHYDELFFDYSDGAASATMNIQKTRFLEGQAARRIAWDQKLPGRQKHLESRAGEARSRGTAQLNGGQWYMLV